MSQENEHLSFAGREALARWLEANDVDLTLWGTGAAKTVEDLWQELQAGESVLYPVPPRRAVQVAQIIIRRGERVLVETAQELAGGRQRQRNLLPAEKMIRGESYQEAALRCLWEELGISASRVQFKPHTYEREEVDAEAFSYPGLPTHYTFHRMEAAVSGLPATSFWRHNTSFLTGDPVKRHQWSWRPSPES